MSTKQFTASRRADCARRIRARSILVALLIAVPIAVFLQTRTYEFVWDDEVNVATNPHMAAPVFSGFREIWQRPYDGLYIPITYTAWAAIAPLARASGPADSNRPSPQPYHLANVVLHILNGLLV